MSKWKVTITGADDQTDPKDLADLSVRFPFVEWGILFSWKRMGTERYPSRVWRDRLRTIWNAYPEVTLAAHLCGDMAGVVMGGEMAFAEGGFRRVQINGFDPEKARRMQRGVYILQARTAQGVVEANAFAMARSGCCILYDVSGGRGVSPESWALPPTRAAVGYAGGIGPDNVTDVLRALESVTPTWIDMESNVRTDDCLDLAKVTSVLEQVQAFNDGLGRGARGA